MIRFAALALLVISCLPACHRTEANADSKAPPSKNGKNNMHAELSIRLGESGASFMKRNTAGVQVNRQPAGLDFYRMDWDNRPTATVRFDHPPHSFTINHVTGIQTSEDQEDLKSEGFVDWKVHALPSDTTTIAHTEAKSRIQALIREIMNAGWEQVVELGDPRLKGRDRLRFAMENSNLIGLDARYEPTMQEWMSLPERTPWRFHAKGVYMELSFSRENPLRDVAKPGVYLLNIELQTTKEYFRRMVAPDDRLRWKEALPLALKSAALQRDQQEKSLRERGFVIDDGYVDPKPPVD